MKIKYANVTVSKSGKSFVAEQTTRPVATKTGGRSWKSLGVILRGGSPKELAEQAKAQGYTLISDPSPTSRFSMKGDDVTDWNGVVIGKYSEGAMTK